MELVQYTIREIILTTQMSSIYMHCVSPLNVASLQLMAFTAEKEVCEAIFDDSNILYK